MPLTADRRKEALARCCQQNLTHSWRRPPDLYQLHGPFLLPSCVPAGAQAQATLVDRLLAFHLQQQLTAAFSVTDPAEMAKTRPPGLRLPPLQSTVHPGSEDCAHYLSTYFFFLFLFLLLTKNMY